LSETEFGLAAVYRIIKKSGAERVSDEAAEELRRVVEEVANDVAKHAIELSVHAGRHTVKAADVRLAAKNILRSQ
jgi:DNA-binding protein